MLHVLMNMTLMGCLQGFYFVLEPGADPGFEVRGGANGLEKIEGGGGAAVIV